MSLYFRKEVDDGNINGEIVTDMCKFRIYGISWILE